MIGLYRKGGTEGKTHPPLAPFGFFAAKFQIRIIFLFSQVPFAVDPLLEIHLSMRNSCFIKHPADRAKPQPLVEAGHGDLRV